MPGVGAVIRTIHTVDIMRNIMSDVTVHRKASGADGNEPIAEHTRKAYIILFSGRMRLVIRYQLVGTLPVNRAVNRAGSMFCATFGASVH